MDFSSSYPHGPWGDQTIQMSSPAQPPKEQRNSPTRFTFEWVELDPLRSEADYRNLSLGGHCRSVKVDHQTSIPNLAFLSADRIVGTDGYGRISVWDARSGGIVDTARRSEKPSPVEKGAPTAIAGNTLFYQDSSGKFGGYDIPFEVNYARLAPDDRTWFLGAYDELWTISLPTGTIEPFQRISDGWIRGFTLNHDATCSILQERYHKEDDTWSLYVGTLGEDVHVLWGEADCACMNHSASLVAHGSFRTLTIVDVQQTVLSAKYEDRANYGKVEWRCEAGYGLQVLAFSPDSRWLACLWMDRQFQIRCTRTMDVIVQTHLPECIQEEPRCFNSRICFSPDGNFILVDVDDSPGVLLHGVPNC
jgi:WD40 repeat protein